MKTMREIMAANAAHGHYFFSKDTMKFFLAQTHGDNAVVELDDGGALFVHSIRFESRGYYAPRQFKIAHCYPSGGIVDVTPETARIDNVGSGFYTLEEALAVMRDKLRREVNDALLQVQPAN